MKKGVIRRNIYLIIVIALVSVWPINTLVIETVEGTHWCPFPSTIRLEISYTHSVSLTKVQDIYEVTGKGLYAKEERWQSSLAGQPLDYQKSEGGFFIKEMHTFLGKEWRYWFIPLNNVTITVNKKPVISHFKREGIVYFRVIKMPLFFTIFRRC